MYNLVKAFIALAAFAAFAVLPAAASATNNPQLFSPTTEAVPTGSNFVTTSGGPTVMTDTEGNTSVACNRAIMTGTLVTNSHAGGVAGNITTASFAGSPSAGTTTGHCDGNVGPTTVTPTGLPWCLVSNNTLGTDKFRVRGGECSKAATAIQFTLDVTTFFGTIQCGYQRTAAQPIEGTYTTHPPQPTTSISKVEFNRYHGSELCPAKNFLDMNFTLYRETAGGFEDAAWIKDVT